MTAQPPSRDDVPEADRLEQQAPVDPPELPDTEAVSDSDDAMPPTPTDEANEADQLEQHEPVGDDEDDYPHEP